jgi:diadenosine tetraphosphate (Ap4A) HIT family hydrolase
MHCIFCQHNRELLTQSELSSAFLDGFPVSKGHTLVIPKRHVVSIWEMTDLEYADAFNLVRRVKQVLQEMFDPHGFNIHIIPRYAGDVPSPRGGVRNIIPGRGNY